jgi:membrane associated rhomboid family serine protease
MIPLRDENPTKAFPFVTIFLIAINAAVFLYELSLGGQLESFVRQFGVIPYDIIHASDFRVYLTLFSSLFLHADLFHILGNMLYLWIFGNNIEDTIGHVRFVFFYLLCGVAASLGHIIFSSGSRVPTIGASGAISGVLGAYLLLYPDAKILTLIPLFYFWRIVKINAKWFLLIWIVFQVLSGAVYFNLSQSTGQGGVAWFAHIAGFFAGIGFLFLFFPGYRRRKRFLD